MNVIGVIPARFGSTRFEGKILATILGKPMIQHVWEQAKQSRLLTDLLIACDDEKVLKIAKEFGAKAVLTSKEHPSGSDRVAEAVEAIDCDIVVNIQGDEPLLPASLIDDLVRALQEDKAIPMATCVKTLDKDEELNDPNIVKAVVDQNNMALYFSRAPIPYPRDKKAVPGRFYKHLGLYAYRKEFLLKFTALPKSALEKAEQLEQLRALEAGFRIKAVETDVTTVGVDTPADLKRVEEILREQNASV